MKQARQAKQAFTLIELLVVISIIALLIGILLPALGAARSSARQVLCLANQRQIATARNIYAVDFNDGMFVAQNPATQLPRSSQITFGGYTATVFSADRALAGTAPGGEFIWQFGGPSGHGILIDQGYIEDVEFFFCPDAAVADLTFWGFPEARQIEPTDENFGAQNWGVPGFSPSRRVGIGTYANRSELVSKDDKTGIARALGLSQDEVYFGSLRFSENANKSLSWCQHQFNDVQGAHGDRGINVVYGDASGQFLPFAGVYVREDLRNINVLYSWLDSRGRTLDQYP
ncbi:type II secretion system protein [Mucisphaera sp.]|uniref:type II secretion system protein n=1 Tax=Mucisphaera sp. TaxID=2913024 RepID=UPI003D0A9DC4